MRCKDVSTVCPGCQMRVRHMLLVSGNTYGAHFWSDGKIEAPLFQTKPLVGACPHCDGLVWFDDHSALRDEEEWEYAPGERPRRVRRLAYREYVSRADQGTALHPAKERALRLYAWWDWNDRLRFRPAKAFPFVPMFMVIGLCSVLCVSNFFHSPVWALFLLCNALMGIGLFLNELLSLQDKRDLRHHALDTMEKDAAFGCDNMRRLYALCDTNDAGDDVLLGAELLRQMGEFEAAIQLLRKGVKPGYQEAARRLIHECTTQNRDLCVLMRLGYGDAPAALPVRGELPEASEGAISLVEDDVDGALTLQ